MAPYSGVMSTVWQRYCVVGIEAQQTWIGSEGLSGATECELLKTDSCSRTFARRNRPDGKSDRRSTDDVTTLGKTIFSNRESAVLLNFQPPTRTGTPSTRTY